VSDAPDKPQAHEVPKSFWEKVKARPWLYAAIAASFIVPLIVGTWLLVQSGGGFSPYPDVEEAVEESRGAEIPESSVEETESAEATGTVEDPDAAQDEVSQNAEPLIAPKIAYRKDGKLYVSAENGGGEQEVAASGRGAFTLSPDGTRLAWIDVADAALHVTEVGGEDIVVGVAEDVAPSWAPDSAWLVFTVPSEQGSIVYRVKADGSTPEMLAPGHSARVSGDGQSVALIASAGPGQPGDVVVVDDEGDRLGHIAGAMAVEAVPVRGVIVYSVAGGKDAEEIRAADPDGTDVMTLVGPARLGVPAVYAQLEPSPDEELLKYAATGDDGYSRVYVVELSGTPTPLALSIRRDTYPLRWASDARNLFIVEGNAFQGEKTSVIRVSEGGLGRTVVVEGGGL
jgi:hypothetical protein